LSHCEQGWSLGKQGRELVKPLMNHSLGVFSFLKNNSIRGVVVQGVSHFTSLEMGYIPMNEGIT